MRLCHLLSITFTYSYQLPSPLHMWPCCLQMPPKHEVLQYLDYYGPKPERRARAVLILGHAHVRSTHSSSFMLSIVTLSLGVCFSHSRGPFSS